MMLATGGSTVQLKTAAALVKERRIDFRRAQKAANAGMSGKMTSSTTSLAKKTKTAASCLVASEDIHALVAWEKPRKIGPGLMNLGNTCYLNSVLQCLMYSPAFAQYLLPRAKAAESSTKQHNGFHAEKAMARLVAQMHAPNAPRVTQPREIVVNLKQLAKFFRIGRQEDSHEFFRHLMDGMHKASLKQAGVKDTSSEATTTLVHSVFGGTLRSHVQCAKCKFVSERLEPFLDLSLEISSGISTVKAALAHFTAVETLDAENAWKCGGCSQRSRASKGLNIHAVPNALVLHLKRFDAFYGKLKKHIAFDEVLSLNQGKVLSQAEEHATYTLTAVLVHSGSSPDCGHYYAFVKSPAGTWHEMNDETVRVVNVQTVLQQRAYMLFYTRKLPKVVKAPPVVVAAAAPKPVVDEIPVKVVKAAVTKVEHDDEHEGETSQESMSEESTEEHPPTAAAPSSSPVKGLAKRTTTTSVRGFAPTFTGPLFRHRRFQTSWQRYVLPVVASAAVSTTADEDALPPAKRPTHVTKAAFRPHQKFANSLLNADVPQWRDEDEDMSADLQMEHNQKVRQLNAEVWQEKRKTQLDYWDQTLDQGKLKKVKARKEFVANEGRANQFQRALEAKKRKRV
ncbi:Aste57867_10442 [Aphanomyces stellatus]|uniref:Ubiquitin carboxyl-terminal hydrolase n=1 Tax=Aphanomyces stellatus TaxID=120398 RepID=A0A485KQZ8_9STRA|nr:hypothetical protein As57867_010402 [Aphanomyces stellatus]VFT87316.1 Aste57867_10442 [Aphanomyces stellatus]